MCQTLGTGGSLSAAQELFLSWKKSGDYLFILKEMKVGRRRRGGGEGGMLRE